MPTADVVILNWDGIEVTAQCLDHLHRHTERPRIRITVVDNGSRDRSNQDRLKSLRDQNAIDQLILHPRNLGFARALNDVFSHSPCEVLCSLNNDCFVEAGWLDAALETLYSDQRVAAVGSNVYGKPERRKIVEDRSIGQLNGALMFIRKPAWEDVGPFDEENFSPAYGEELDWSYRAVRRGYALKLSGKSLACHIGSYTAKKNMESDEIRVVRLAHRIKCRLFNWSWTRLLITSWKIYYYELEFEIKNRTLRLLARAFLKTLANLPAILSDRRKRFAVSPIVFPR